jgi:ABC-2 type transport system permease protein
VSFSRYLTTTVAMLRMIFRRRITLFWSLLFPIILMTLLGLLFGQSLNAGTIAVVNTTRSDSATEVVATLDSLKGVTVKTAPDAATARKQVTNGDRDAALILTPGPNRTVSARLYTSNTSADQAGIIRGIVSGVTNRVAIAATGRPPAVTLQSQSVDSSSLSYIDFLLPGIIGLSIMISAVISLATVMVKWRENGVLRRIKLTPIPLAEFFAARVTAGLAVAVIQVCVLIVFGRLAFGIDISTTAWAAIPVAIAGCLCFLALGFAIGSVVATAETGDAVSNVITNPMMFLSGTFFPVAAMPFAVQQFAKLLPLYYLINGLRDTIVRGQGLEHVLPEIGVLLVMTLVLAAVAMRTFRWEART